MDFLRRQLRFRDYRFGPVAGIVASVYLVQVLLGLVFVLYYRANPDPNEAGATFEVLSTIVLTAPTSFILLPILAPLTYLVPGAGWVTAGQDHPRLEGPGP